jgi:hypothetical protein
MGNLCISNNIIIVYQVLGLEHLVEAYLVLPLQQLEESLEQQLNQRPREQLLRQQRRERPVEDFLVGEQVRRLERRNLLSDLVQEHQLVCSVKRKPSQRRLRHCSDNQQLNQLKLVVYSVLHLGVARLLEQLLDLLERP